MKSPKHRRKNAKRARKLVNRSPQLRDALYCMDKVMGPDAACICGAVRGYNGIVGGVHLAAFAKSVDATEIAASVWLHAYWKWANGLGPRPPF